MNTLLLIASMFLTPDTIATDTIPYVMCTQGQLDTSMNHSEPAYYMNSEECLEIDYFVVADYEFYLENGSSVQNCIDHIIDVTDAMNADYVNPFSSQVRFNIVGIQVATSASQEYWIDEEPTTITSYLSSFSSWGQTNGPSRDLTSLWTGRNLSGSVIGVAYVGTVCGNYAYNVLENFTSNDDFLRNLVSHEIGHNLAAVHDASGSSFVMSPSVTGTNNWSTASISDINGYITSNVNCASDCSPIIEGPDTCFGDVTIYDTTYITNTVINTITVDVYDTVVTVIDVDVYDTIVNIVEVDIYDTIITIENETIVNVITIDQYDTNIVVITVNDTVINIVQVTINDTTYMQITLNDTVYNYITVDIYDTIYIIDTIYITDTICDFTTGFGTQINPSEMTPQIRGTFNLLGQRVGTIRKSGYYIVDGVLYYVTF